MDIWKEAVGGLSTSLAFLTRLPLPSFLFRDPQSADPDAVDAQTVDRAVWAFPVVGLLIGVVQVLAVMALVVLGAHPWVVSVLVLAGSLMLTGALHEDGLADVADALGGRAREQKLSIMKDSRLGAFGVLAMVLALLLKAVLLAELAGAFNLCHAVVILIGAAVWSRGLMVVLWGVLPAASQTGLGSTGPTARRVWIALGLSVLILLALMPYGAGLVFWCALWSIVVLAGFTIFAGWQFGGATGDVCGAAQMLGELTFFAVALSLIGNG